MAMKDLGDLFEHTLKDIYYAEKKIEKELPKMAKKADSADLRKAFEEHHEETKEQIENLEKIFKELDMKAEGEKCEAIEGILKEAKHVMDEIEDKDALDAGMIAWAQAVEHCEITRYGTLVAWAKRLGKPKKVIDLINENLDQEYAADRKLTDMATDDLNKQAA